MKIQKWLCHTLMGIAGGLTGLWLWSDALAGNASLGWISLWANLLAVWACWLHDKQMEGR